MKSLFFSVLLLFFMGCATSTKVLESDFQQLSRTKTGAILTVNLETNGRVRDDKNCSLKIEDENNQFELKLKRGEGDYALPLLSNEKNFEITKITCGPFYYYDLKNQGAAFSVKNQKIKYLGVVNFKLEDKGELEWGHATKDERELLRRAQLMGLTEEDLEIDLLKL
jgi:hypothetical protein